MITAANTKATEGEACGFTEFLSANLAGKSLFSASADRMADVSVAET
jgi:hypothetical protein